MYIADTPLRARFMFLFPRHPLSVLFFVDVLLFAFVLS